jgi:hypothetical protein
MGNDFPLFTGNCPKNVSKDAKYSVRRRDGELVVGLLYRTDHGEEWHAATGEHPDLIEMVNAVKTTKGDSPNGPFYVNEYGQVIVPVGPQAEYYLAGEFDGLIRFEFEGHVLTGEGKALDGTDLNPGDIWTGPHPGIPYVLAADGRDVYYESHPRAHVTRKVRLSSEVGVAEAAAFAKRIQQVKGWGGGRFYVNEWCEIFAPVNHSGGLSYRYVGSLGLLDEPWFAKPTPTVASTS